MARTLAPGEKPRYIKESAFAGIKRSIMQGFSWGGMLKGGDIQQVGGEFLFVGGDCVWVHRMKNVRDHLELEELRRVMGIEGEKKGGEEGVVVVA